MAVAGHKEFIVWKEGKMVNDANTEGNMVNKLGYNNS